MTGGAGPPPSARRSRDPWRNGSPRCPPTWCRNSTTTRPRWRCWPGSSLSPCLPWLPRWTTGASGGTHKAMDSTAREQALRSAILTGTAALARSLPPMFQPMAAPIVSLVQQQVASVSLPDLLEFLTEARDRLDQLIEGGTAGLVIENPPLAAHSS